MYSIETILNIMVKIELLDTLPLLCDNANDVKALTTCRGIAKRNSDAYSVQENFNPDLYSEIEIIF